MIRLLGGAIGRTGTLLAVADGVDAGTGGTIMSSSGSGEVSLEGVLDLLDRWRHLPAYQLERRADVLFAMFLPKVLERCGASNLCLIPEFPIKKSLVGNDRTSQSIKVDYLAISKDLTRAFIVELKTDMMSIDQKQVEDLKRASRKGMAEIVSGLKCIVLAKSVTAKPEIRGKYFNLLTYLEHFGLIDIPDVDGLKNLIPSGKYNSEEYKDRIEEIRLKGAPSIKLVYVIPEEPEKPQSCWLHGIPKVYFKEISEHAKNTGGTVGGVFAESLERWRVPAGAPIQW